MTDLEKLITELLEIPSIDLEGNEEINVRYVTLRTNEPFVLLEGTESIYLDPSQALALLDWLKEQRGNLEELQEALRAQQVEDASTKEQREAERINALHIKHSQAVMAWKKAGCIGECPSFEDIVFKEQFIRVDLGGALESIPVTFVKQYPMLERMRKGENRHAQS